MRIVLAALVLLLAGGCARHPPPADPAAALAERLSRAGDLVRAGCLDCLLEARREFAALRELPTTRTEATAALIKTSVLIAVREDELGLLPGEALRDAISVAAGEPAPETFAPFLDFAAAYVRGGNAGLSGPVADRDVLTRMRANRELGTRAATALRERASTDLAAASLWLGQVCAAGSDLPGRDERLSVVGRFAETPLLGFTRAIRCPDETAPEIEQLLNRDPRFIEANYYLAGRAEAGLLGDAHTRGRPDLDAAEARFQAAYEWRQDWPAATVAIANVAMTAEDFARALVFYERTLALVPNHPAAMLGRVRALSYAGRSREGIAASDAMLADGVNPGDARYWRAFNEAQLEDYNAAWDDIERAGRFLINADVPKLAGIIAINRRDYPTARERLELAVERRAGGCDAMFYLQAVLAEQRAWQPAAERSAQASICLDAEILDLTGEIATLTAEESSTRTTRIVARRQAQLDGDRSRRFTTWFNAAVANLNLGKTGDARAFALKAVDDARFAARAKEILERVK